jgi:hypothetical protein
MWARISLFWRKIELAPLPKDLPWSTLPRKPSRQGQVRKPKQAYSDQNNSNVQTIHHLNTRRLIKNAINDAGVADHLSFW